MKKIYVLTFILVNVFLINTFAQNGSRDDVMQTNYDEGMVINQSSVETGTWFYFDKSVLLYDNGPLITHPASAGGADTSMLQTGLGMNTLGAGVQFLSGNRMADDFTLTDACNIDSIAIYAYQTGSTTTSTITGLYLRVWDGIPEDSSSTLIWGDLVTNIMSGTEWTNIYRMSETTPGTTRPIFVSYAVTAGLQLQPGTYWLEWTIDGSLASGPWAPPISILGTTTTGNARQYTSSSTSWIDFTDSGTLTPQGMPFKIYGSLLANDVGVVALLSPVTGELTDSEIMTVTIENFGDFDEINFPLMFQVNGGTVNTETITTNVPYGTNVDFTLPGTFDFSAPGQFEITLWTELTGDNDVSNDTLTVMLNNTTHIAENENAAFSVYPNPAVVSVRISGKEIVSLIEIFDVNGSLIYSDVPMEADFIVSLENFRNGVYAVNLHTQNGKQIHKIVK